MAADDALARGRAAFANEAWTEARAGLTAADRDAPLGPEDLDRLATAAYLVGDDAAAADARMRAHAGFLERGETIRAAGSAFWLAFTILDNPSQQSQAGGWLARARRLLDECPECAEQGFLQCALAFQSAVAGDIAAAQAGFAQAAALGSRLKNADLTALARHGQGRILLGTGRTAEGLAMIDEVMVSVTCGEVAPMVAGVIYCSVISACYDAFDLRRAHEWTTALAHWCGSHPDMVPFRGQCLIRRSELLQLHGAWPEAMDEAERACQFLGAPQAQPDVGWAFYQAGELHRLRGELDRADAAYRRASLAGRAPQPGLALLRLAQGDLDAALAAIQRALQDARGRTRAHVLRAAVDVLLAADDLPGAQRAADDLKQLAADTDAPFLRAAAAHAAGAVALAAGDEEMAGDGLREAMTLWRELDMPYETARVRSLVGLVNERLGDAEGAQLEFEAAQETFDRLGAAPDAARLAHRLESPAPQPSGLLTGRELEVLRLVATGRTNRTIAADLAISEKTVARHLSNIFTKLDLSSRSAATAYAYAHKLV